MKKFNKVIALVLAVLFVAASFAACSSNSGKDDKGTTEAAKTQKVKVIDIALSDEEYAFGVDKKQPELKEKANAFIKELKENGKLDEICNHYFGSGEPAGVTSATEDSWWLPPTPSLSLLSTRRATPSTALTWRLPKHWQTAWAKSW